MTDNREECQFELWTECNSKCTFCYLGKNNIKTPDEIKLKQLDQVIKVVNDPDTCEKFNKLAFIGGEFFQGQLNNAKVKEKFMQLFDDVSNLLNSDMINEVWVCATLTIGEQPELYEVLNKFKDLSKVWVLTSYDTIGRFHTQKMKETWLENMRKLRKTYPELKLNITSILTGDFINKYMDDSLDLFGYASELKASIFLKPACPMDRDEHTQMTKEETNKVLPNFFPTRDQFLQFLYKFKQQETDFMYDKLFNMKYRSDYLIRFDEDEMHCSHRVKEKQQEFYDKFTTNTVNKCGHSTQYQIYLDDSGCAVCDKQMVKDLLS